MAAAERKPKAPKGAKSPKPSKRAHADKTPRAPRAPKARREGMPERIVVDSTVLIFALDHDNPRRKGDPRVADCRELWDRALRESRVLLPPFVVLDLLAVDLDEEPEGAKPTKAAKARAVKREALVLPAVRAVEHVAFTYQVAERMALWARPRDTKAVAKDERTPRRVVGHDAMIVGIAEFYRADVLVTLDPGTKRLAKLAGVRVAEPREMLRGTQRELFR